MSDSRISLVPRVWFVPLIPMIFLSPLVVLVPPALSLRERKFVSCYTHVAIGDCFLPWQSKQSKAIACTVTSVPFLLRCSRPLMRFASASSEAKMRQVPSPAQLWREAAFAMAKRCRNQHFAIARSTFGSLLSGLIRKLAEDRLR